jgi:hypothetical protein
LVLALGAGACGDSSSSGTPDAAEPDALVADAAPVTCGAPTAPAGGTYEAGCDGRGDGERCLLTCDLPEFGSTEPGGATCTAGTWSQPTCAFDLDLDDDGARRYPWGPDLDDDDDGATTMRLGGTDTDDVDPDVQATAGAGTFTAGATIELSAGAGTTDLATGDLDRDGDLDLVFTNQNSHEFQIALGRGDGTFAPATSISLAAALLGSGDGGARVMLGDFDEDGDLDLFGARRRLFFGEGDGTFAAAPNPPWTVYSNVVADLDADGHLDMLGLKTGVGPAVLFGSGDGTWRDAEPVATAVANASDLAVGWLDDDDQFDVVLSTTNTEVVPALGASDGTFAVGAATYSSYVGPVAIGDVDGDDLADVVSANPIGGQIYVALGNGVGGLTHDGAISTGIDSATSIHLLDVDGDGARDVVATFQNGGLLVGLGDGVGGFAPLTAYPLIGAFAVVPGDYDRDGTLDLAVATFDADAQIFLGD